MSSNTQNQHPEKPGSQKSKFQSVFNQVKLIKGQRPIICTNLTGKQATSLVIALDNELNSPLLIKFTGMEVSQ